MKVVFDTNIYISAFAIPGGKAEEAYLLALQGRFQLITSVAILTETAATLQSKFEWSAEKTERLISHLSRVTDVLRTQPHLHILSDEPDNRILECGVQAQADRIVTGDRPMLALKHYENSTIVSLSGFLQEIHL
ncbi:MAG: PIN domain-containing protein [Nitrospirales bacterium]|nr:MAG: PIN domain-containing protein [Nitrospirales bacterium]